MWEYQLKVYTFRFDWDLIKILNDEGQKNWEIINYSEEREKYGCETTAKVLFKRKIDGNT